MKEQLLLNSTEVNRIIREISEAIFKSIIDIDHFAIVGVHTRGVELANRVQKQIEELSGSKVKSGILDVTFHRDDLATRGMLPVIKETRINFDITKMRILLVDDVLFTGRTTKAALETLTSFGRPSSIQLFVMVDRGNRELPIQPDYCGYSIDTHIHDSVKVMLSEIDDTEDSVVLSRKQDQD